MEEFSENIGLAFQVDRARLAYSEKSNLDKVDVHPITLRFLMALFPRF